MIRKVVIVFDRLEGCGFAEQAEVVNGYRDREEKIEC